MTRSRLPGTPILAILMCALFVWASTAALAGQDDPPPEHPVVKPMTGATASARSHVDDFGMLVVNYRGAAASDQRVAEGR